ncbi:MAG TPA: murein transglycosylase, partial [Tenacibaculum sp.]|nr:murein transglycosylase [Tenacibaculum sp.]
MKIKLRLFPAIVISCVATLLVNTISKQNEPTIKNVAENYEIMAVKIPSNLNLAGERIPIERQDIRERMDRELLVNTYWQSNSLLLIKRAHKYFPIIEPLLNKYGLPDDFKYLALAESGFMNVRSYAGAAGFWQFLKGTAKQYGLEVNNNVDERYHLEKATEVAAKYLKNSK